MTDKRGKAAIPRPADLPSPHHAEKTDRNRNQPVQFAAGGTLHKTNRAYRDSDPECFPCFHIRAPRGAYNTHGHPEKHYQSRD
jgi:hypothetical protein